MKKRIVSVICCVMIASMLFTIVSCRRNEETSNDSETTNDVSEIATDKNGLEVDGIEEYIDYGGREVGILGWSGGGEIDFDRQSGTTLAHAIFARNAAVEERLGVKLRINSSINGGNPTQAEYIATVETMLSGATDYDLLAPYSMIPAVLAMDGFLVNLAEKEQLQLEGKPWWSQDILENSLINGKVFFMSGPISPKLLYETMAIMVNLDMVDAYMLEDPRTLVKDYKWTMEKMFEMSRGIGTDVTGNGKDDGDKYGLIMVNTLVDGFVASNGMRYLDGYIDQNTNVETLFLDRDFDNGLKIIDLIDRISSVTKTPDVWVVNSTNSFYLGNALFLTATFDNIRENKEKMTFNYGYLPYPMESEDQQRYYSTAGFPYSMWCIPKASLDTDCAAYTLECLASESYRKVQPVVHDDIKFKFSGDVINTEMFDIIVGSITFDYGRLFNNNFTFVQSPVWTFRDSVVSGASFSTAIAANRNHINETLVRLNKLFA